MYNYIAGLGKSMAGAAGTVAGHLGHLPQAGKNIGQLGSYMYGAMGGTAKGALIGGAAGGLYGAAAEDTGIIGGALMGAGLGAGGMRYGGAGIKSAMSKWNTSAGMFAGGAYGGGMSTLGSAFARGTYGTMRSDIMGAYRGASLMANQGMGRVASSLKGSMP